MAVESTVGDVFATICIGIGFVYAIIVSVLLLKALFVNDDTVNKTHGVTKCIAIFTASFYIISIFLTFSALLYMIIIWRYPIRTGYIYIGIRGGIVFYVLSQWLLLLIFVVRVHHSFKNSLISMKSLQIRLMYGLFCTMVFLVLLLIFFMFLEIKWALFVIGGLWAMIYMGFQVTLIYIFISKIDTLMKMDLNVITEHEKNYKIESVANTPTDTNTTPTSVDVINTDIINTDIINTMMSDAIKVCDLIDMTLLSLSVRYALLVSIAIITSFICEILVVVLSIMINGEDGAYQSGVYLLLVLDLVLNLTSMYLLFSPTDYDKGCKICDMFCKQWRIQRITRKLNKKTTLQTQFIHLVAGQ